MTYSKNGAMAMSLLVLALILAPVTENWDPHPEDSFPFSYYPMFSHKRDAVYGMYYLVGYDSLHRRISIPYRALGTGGFNQVRRQLNKGARSDDPAAFVERIAERLTREEDEPYSALVELELVRGYYHMEDYFLRRQTDPLREKLLVCHTISTP